MITYKQYTLGITRSGNHADEGWYIYPRQY